MPSIFISYRRDDASLPAHLLLEEVRRRFGTDSVFIDIAMPPGVDFVVELNRALAECRVLLALIGKGWLDARDEQGRRRVDNPDDYVRMEVGSALERPAVVVIPVLVDDVAIPSATSLSGLADLASASPGAAAAARPLAG